LAHTIPGVSYFDCELPRVRRVIEEDPEGFLEQGFSGPLVLDEVHRLENPSEILKIPVASKVHDTGAGPGRWGR